MSGGVQTEESGRGPNVLAVTGVRKAFGATLALDDVSFELCPGEIHALLGGNGSGKSTLIKILAGIQPADRGELSMRGQKVDLRKINAGHARDLGLHFVHQQSSVFPELSVLENLSIGRGFETGAGGRISWRQARARTRDVLERFRIEASPDQLLGELSAARQMMVAIARALQDQGDGTDSVLVLDEPTASLPAPEVSLLLESLRQYADAGQGIVYVTHRLEEVFAIADRATLLKDGQLVESVTPAHLTHEGLVELMLGRTVRQVSRREECEAGPEILKVSGLAARPLTGIDLTACEGEIIGVGGLLGSGRSTLLKALFGVVSSDGAEILLDGEPREIRTPADAMEAGIAYVPEDRQRDASFSELTVGENLSITVITDYWRRGRLSGRREHQDAVGLFDRYLIKAESDSAPLSSLSGGNQQKVILARWLRRNPRVLLLDEPTQGVDVGARAEIYDLIQRAVEGGAVAIIASSDFEELATVCDRVVVLRKGAVVGQIARDDLSADEITRLANAEVST